MPLLFVLLCITLLPREGKGCLASYNPDIPPATTTFPTTTAVLTTTTTSLSCMAGWVFFAETGFCYFQGGAEASSLSARMVCQGMGGDLASIHSQAENDFVTSLIPVGPPLQTVALGGRRTGAGNTDADFSNWDGTPFDYSNWGGGEPNIGDCVHTFTEQNGPIGRGQWYDIGCGIAVGFYICKAPPM